MPAVDCDIAGCDYKTADVGDAVGAAMLTQHYASKHPPTAPRKAPAIPQPKLSGKIHEDSWDSFTREWEVYQKTTAIPPGSLAVYLMSCCAPDLKASVEKEDPAINTKDVNVVLSTIKRHAVINVASSVLQTELLSLKQDHEEPIRQFASRALGKARNCKLTEKCNCGVDVDFSKKNGQVGRHYWYE